LKIASVVTKMEKETKKAEKEKELLKRAKIDPPLVFRTSEYAD
jgi:hypothetical protein